MARTSPRTERPGACWAFRRRARRPRA